MVLCGFPDSGSRSCFAASQEAYPGLLFGCLLPWQSMVLVVCRCPASLALPARVVRVVAAVRAAALLFLVVSWGQQSASTAVTVFVPDETDSLEAGQCTLGRSEHLRSKSVVDGRPLRLIGDAGTCSL